MVCTYICYKLLDSVANSSEQVLVSEIRYMRGHSSLTKEASPEHLQLSRSDKQSVPLKYSFPFTDPLFFPSGPIFTNVYDFLTQGALP